MMRVLRYYHGGRDPAHRARDRALVAAGVEVVLAVPTSWPGAGPEAALSDEEFETVELDVHRSGDVNRHRLADRAQGLELLDRVRPDVLDVHAEPVSLVARDWLALAGPRPITMYTAQNVDKRFPPPFSRYEVQALRRVEGLYPCSRQAASVARGKGFAGAIEVLPLGVDPVFTPGHQEAEAPLLELGIVGRLVPEKGIRDAVQVLAAVSSRRRARLHVVGEGPEAEPARALARELGVLDSVVFTPWQDLDGLAALYRQLHVLLVPSSSTTTWVEQFGRIIVEGMASGAVVAAYDSGAIAEVSDGATVLAPQGRPAELASAVVALVSDPAAYRQLRRLGIHRAASATWDDVARAQSQLYQAVLSKDVRRVVPRRAAPRRRMAREEYGSPARLHPAVARPFALPVLRENTAGARALARAVDLVNTAAGR